VRRLRALRLRASTALRAAARSVAEGPVSRVATDFLAAAARLVADFAAPVRGLIARFVAREGRRAAVRLTASPADRAGRLATAFLLVFLAVFLVVFLAGEGRLAVDFFFREGAGGVTWPALFLRAAAALAWRDRASRDTVLRGSFCRTLETARETRGRRFGVRLPRPAS
jgi:hypothetical protein